MDKFTEILIPLEIAAKRAYARGIQTGSGGNLSARVPNQASMMVKSSGGSFADCNKNGEGFVLTDFWGVVQGNASEKPTREAFLHGLIYRLRPEIGGVLHSHSPWSITWSFKELPLPMITHHLKLKFGCPIPVINIPSPMVRAEDGPLIEQLYKENPSLPAFILLGHGIVATGKDILEAEHNAELVEETAQIAVLSSILTKKPA